MRLPTWTLLLRYAYLEHAARFGAKAHELERCDWQAVSENPDLKAKIFSTLAQVTAQDAILSTNTSSISITKIASTTGSQQRAQNVIGMHFMNPVRFISSIIPTSRALIWNLDK